MIMFNKLPHFVILQGKKYRINVDFRNMISFENKVEDKTIDKAKKIEHGLRCFYFDFFYLEDYLKLLHNPQVYQEACDKLIWFYKCGRDNYHKTTGKGKGQNKQIYSYKFDDEYIYGAFYEQYGIDLAYDKVHWWKFKSLLKSLKDDTEFVKIKSYRSYTGKDENRLKLKEYWELPLSLEEQNRLNQIYETLK